MCRVLRDWPAMSVDKGADGERCDAVTRLYKAFFGCIISGVHS